MVPSSKVMAIIRPAGPNRELGGSSSEPVSLGACSGALGADALGPGALGSAGGGAELRGGGFDGRGGGTERAAGRLGITTGLGSGTALGRTSSEPGASGGISAGSPL